VTVSKIIFLDKGTCGVLEIKHDSFHAIRILDKYLFIRPIRRFSYKRKRKKII
jgi:hypothetical protein